MSYFQRPAKNPWSRPIDYDKEIADDLKRIADLEKVKAMGWFLSPEHAARRNEYHFDLIGLFMENREKARAFDISDDDLEAYAHVADYSEAGLKLYGFSDDYAFPSGWWQRGEAFAKKVSASTYLGVELLTEAQHVDHLKKAKASLARHRRNQKKYTGKG